MKSLHTLAALGLFITAALAQASPMRTLINSSDFNVFLNYHEQTGGYRLQSISDLGVETGIRARCPCYFFKVTLKAVDLKECKIELKLNPNTSEWQATAKAPECQPK